jgi:hypothetical protein
MTLAVFSHPTRAHARRHDPRGYNPYAGFKDWLRDEFQFRCVYCLERELWYPDRADSFSTDHVVPQCEDPTLTCEYRNLVYACTRCNSAKRECRLLDPTAAAFGNHVRLGDDGVLIGLTPDGNDLIELLHLNRDPALRVRRSFLRILAYFTNRPDDVDVVRIYIDAFGYPDDMPDLRMKRPPGGNGNEGSERSCYFAMRERGELSQTY